MPYFLLIEHPDYTNGGTTKFFYKSKKLSKIRHVAESKMEDLTDGDTNSEEDLGPDEKIYVDEIKGYNGYENRIKKIEELDKLRETIKNYGSYYYEYKYYDDYGEIVVKIWYQWD